MRNTAALTWAALALASLVAAGCSGSGNLASALATPTPLPSPTATCTPPANEAVQMVFPQNNMLNQPNLEGVVFAVAPSPLPTNWYVYATSTFGSTAGTSSIAFLATAAPSATPFPTPSDTPSFAPSLGPPIYESASIGTFANNTAFTIYLANTNCFPGIQESTFTTSLTDSPTATPSPTST